MKPAAALLDLGGTLHIDDAAIPGAIDAVARLRSAGIAMRAVSNTSRRTRSDLVTLLTGMGFDFQEDELLTAPLAARRWIEARNLRPFLLVHENLLPEFAGVETREPNAVLVADAGDGFSHENLNSAFRLLMDGAPLVATGVNRYFQEGNALSLDAGPFVRALEYAAGTSATLAGKPARTFFQAALDALECPPANATMIGDDAENDVAGAINAGLQGILVRTGKYRTGDEAKVPGAQCAEDIRAAVERLVA